MAYGRKHAGATLDGSQECRNYIVSLVFKWKECQKYL